MLKIEILCLIYYVLYHCAGHPLHLTARETLPYVHREYGYNVISQHFKSLSNIGGSIN